MTEHTSPTRRPPRLADLVAAERRAPELHVVVGLEQTPRVYVLADSSEDETRMRVWLARPEPRQRIADTLDSVFGAAA